MDLKLDNYFSHLNSLSLKIARDINAVKSTYGRETWHSLTLNDQENVLNQYFIKPDIHNKYNNKSIPEKLSQVKTNLVYSYNGQDLHTYIYQNVGMKMLHDENQSRHCRDEHSFPFSYRTKSQINIPLIGSIRAESTLIGVSKSEQSINSETRNNIKKLSIINITEGDFKRDVDPIRNNVRQLYNDHQSNEKSLLLIERLGSKKSNLTDFSDSDNEFKEDTGQEERDKLLSPDLHIPKGFDFLSNW